MSDINTGDRCSFCGMPREACKVILWAPEEEVGAETKFGICSTCVARCVVLLEKAVLGYAQGHSSPEPPQSRLIS